jgi:hypothetical protein
MRKFPFVLAMAATVPLLAPGKVARAEDIRPAMEIANAQFLAAFNMPNPSAFLPLYTKDSVLFFQGALPGTGPEAIKQFWESRIKLGVKDHYLRHHRDRSGRQICVPSHQDNHPTCA